MSQLVLSEDVADENLRAAVFERVPTATLRRQIASAEEWLTGSKSDVFPLVKDRFSYLRRFAPTLFEKLAFSAEPTGNRDLTEAIRVLREMDRAGKRKVPGDAPTSFIKKKTRPFVETEGRLDRAGYESAVLTAIRDEVRRGNLFVEGSKRFRKIGDFFMPEKLWEAARENFFTRAGLPAAPAAARQYLKDRLDRAYDRFLTGLPSNAYVSVTDDGSWALASDPAQKLSEPDKQALSELSRWLESKARRIRLPDLLIEADNDLAFTRHFFAGGRAERSPESVCQAIAAVIAYGCNLGPVGMARQTKGVTYRQIKRIADWRLHEDALRSALADLTNGISTLDTASVWGDATTSSSDGQRFLFPRKTVKRTYSHRLSDYALEFYTFVADNYAPFYGTPIECTERDAAYVLDGLLYHESDLEPEEHFVDTHGYTECNFAAFAMLGKRFCPRIRGLSKQRIYHTGREEGYGPLGPMLSGAKRRIHFDWIERHWDRIAQLVASFALGHTTASVAMKRLVSFGAENRLYRAMRELGRVFKSEFILDYMARPQLRRRVRQGLLKSEEIHAMARSVFYGKLGRADWRDFRRQMSSASCLLLVLKAIIYWQIREIERAIGGASENELSRLRLDLLSRVSPVGWENVQLYGQYELRPELVRV
jgi:TnpA family transposase